MRVRRREDKNEWKVEYMSTMLIEHFHYTKIKRREQRMKTWKIIDNTTFPDMLFLAHYHTGKPKIKE